MPTRSCKLVSEQEKAKEDLKLKNDALRFLVRRVEATAEEAENYLEFIAACFHLAQAYVPLAFPADEAGQLQQRLEAFLPERTDEQFRRLSAPSAEHGSA